MKIAIITVVALLTITGIYMWPFTQKRTTLIIPSKDECKWEVSQGQYNDEPIMVRKNITIQSLIRHPDLTIKIGFAIPLKIQNKGGLPDPKENIRMGEIEDVIELEVMKDHTAVFALVITMGTFKEFVFYAKPGTDIGATHRRLMDNVKDYEIQCVGQNDPSWSAYDMFKY